MGFPLPESFIRDRHPSSLILLSAMEVDSATVDILWKSAFKNIARPKLYTTTTSQTDGDFKSLNDPQEFVQDFDGITHTKLYASAANNQLAMKLAQDEYVAIDRIIKQIKDKESNIDPQSLEDSAVFEAEKEAALYGYKYRHPKPALLRSCMYGEVPESEVLEQEKKDVHFAHDAFLDGGFYPDWTKQQYKSFRAEAKDPNNLDGWVPVVRNGKKLVPRPSKIQEPKRMQAERLAVERSTKKRKRGDLDREEVSRPGSSSETDVIETPSRAVNKPLTRFKGSKHPPTRDVSEAPSWISTPRGRRTTTPRFGSPASTSGRAPTSTTKKRKVTSSVSANTALPVDPSMTSRDDLFSRRWTGPELKATVVLSHAWLNDDPTKALVWKNKILSSDFPVRTFSMFKKWAYWKTNGQAKRPRKIKEKDDVPREVERKGRDEAERTGLIFGHIARQPPSPEAEIEPTAGKDAWLSASSPSTPTRRSLRSRQEPFANS
jgi:hypothetical protein